MKKLLLLAFILINGNVFSQIQKLSFGLAVNQPVITSSSNSIELSTPIPSTSGFTYISTSGTVKESFEEKTGLDINIKGNYSITERFFLSSGLTASYFRFKRFVTLTQSAINLPGIPTQSGLGYGDIKFVNVNPGIQPTTTLASSPRLGETSMLYLQMPILAGVSLLKNKLLVRGGIAPSLLLRSSVYRDQYSAQNQNIEQYKDTSGDGITKILVSGMFQTSFMIRENISIDATVQKFFSPIYKGDAHYGGKATYNVLSLGASFHLKG